MSEHVPTGPRRWLGVAIWAIASIAGCERPEAPPAQQSESTASPRICDSPSRTEYGPPSRIADLCVDPNTKVVDLDPISTQDFDQLCSRRFASDCPEYVHWGLRRFVQLRFIAATGEPENLEVTLLRFATPEAAHALFTVRGLSRVEPGQRDVVAVSGSSRGLILGSSAMVYRGTDFVEMRYYNRQAAGKTEETLARQRLGEFAPRFVDALPGQPEPPRVFKLFPDDHRLSWGLRSSYRTAFGVAEVGPSTIGYYRDGKRAYSIFAASYPDDAAASDVYRALRRLPGRHVLEDVPFDAFEVSAAFGTQDVPSLWLVGKNGGRVAAVGSRRPPPKKVPRAEVDWIERDAKMRLMRQLFARR